jgi:hypothetical protein
MKRLKNTLLLLLAFVLPLAIWSCESGTSEGGDAGDQTEMEAADQDAPTEAGPSEEPEQPAQDTTAKEEHPEGGGSEHPEHPSN